MSKPTLTWKVAVAGGAVLGAGFGSVALAGADGGTPPSTVEVDQFEQQLNSPGAPLSVIPAPAVDLSEPASADSAVTPTPEAVAPADVQDVESVASPATPASAPSAPSAPSAQQADVAPAPAPAAEESAPSPASPDTPAEAVAPVEAAEPGSPPSPTSPPTQIEDAGDESDEDED